MDLEDCYPPAEIVEKMVLVRKQTDREVNIAKMKANQREVNIAKMNANEQLGLDEVEYDIEGDIDEN